LAIFQNKQSRKIHDSKHPTYYGFHAEDAVILELFRTGGDIERKGFYVDIGAYKPVDYSLTYRFYEHGWRGINVDPAEGMKTTFDTSRPEDINIQCAVGDDEGQKKFYILKNPQENTLSQEEAHRNKTNLLSQTTVTVYKLATLLETYKPSDIAIDFLSIDVEGLEMNVLTSNDWERFSPKTIAVEQLRVTTLEELADSDVYRFLKNQGYEFFAKTPCTVFYYSRKYYDIYSHLRSPQ
jgi:FkbM family methyltransferase